jgi:hypothetical protein
MNPYLENPELWSEVHSRLIVGIADELTDHLSEQYRVAMEKRVYASSGDENLLVGIPDVSVVSKRSEAEPPTNVATPTPQPITVTVPMLEEVQERYLEIREAATGAVVTVIEILSPKNKRVGEGRQAYGRKRNQVLGSLSHLIEIDLLRGGQLLPIRGGVESDYRILVSRSDRRPYAELYVFTMQQSIPPIPVPLMPGDEEPILDIQTVLQRIYEKGRYHLAIDYSQSLQPALSPENTVWIDEQLKEAGLR